MTKAIEMMNLVVSAPKTNKVEEKFYCVKDSNGHFNAKISIYSNNLETGKGDYVWDYFFTTYPYTWNASKEKVELKIQKLRELNSLAGYDVDWEVAEFTNKEIRNLLTEQHQKDEELGRNHLLAFHYNFHHELKDVQKGCVTKYRKMVRDIYKKYEFMPKKQVV